MSDKFTTLGEQMAAIHKSATEGEVDPRLVSAEARYIAMLLSSKRRGEWRKKWAERQIQDEGK